MSPPQRASLRRYRRRRLSFLPLPPSLPSLSPPSASRGDTDPVSHGRLATNGAIVPRGATRCRGRCHAAPRGAERSVTWCHGGGGGVTGDTVSRVSMCRVTPRYMWCAVRWVRCLLEVTPMVSECLWLRGKETCDITSSYDRTEQTLFHRAGAYQNIFPPFQSLL